MLEPSVLELVAGKTLDIQSRQETRTFTLIMIVEMFISSPSMVEILSNLPVIIRGVLW